MPQELYYPCIKNWDTGEITIKVAGAMPHQAAVDYLKQHHSGAWASVNARPQPVDHPSLSAKLPTP